MANNSKKSSRAQSKKNSTKQPPNTKEQATSATAEELAQTLLPLYQPLDLSSPPSHLEVINRKIRALKKKLRRIYDIEQAIQQGSKKVTKEQENTLANKPSLERMLADFEEIKASVAQVDISVQLRLLLGVFFAAASTSSDALTGLSTLLLPPSCPSANYNPQQELQHACSIAQQFLSNSQEVIFDQPPTTFTQLQDEVKEFLIPKEVSTPVKSEEIVKEEPAPEPVIEPETTVIENSTPPPSDEIVKEPSTTKVEKESKPSKDEEKKPKENKDVKKPNNRRGSRKSRGDKSHGDRGYSKRGRGKSDRANSNDKSSKGTETKERDEKRTRGNNRGRGGRGRPGNNRNRTKDTPKEAPPVAK